MKVVIGLQSVSDEEVWLQEAFSPEAEKER
jgi:hypothetical protein